MLTLCALLAAMQTTFTVPGDYPTLLEATLGAPDGSTIVVQGGVHEFLTVDGKSMTIVAEPRATLVGAVENGGKTNPVNLLGRIGYRPTVRIRGFDMTGTAGGPRYASTLATVSGGYLHAAIFEDCTIRGFDWTHPYSPWWQAAPGLSAVELYETERVEFHDCRVRASAPIEHGYGLDGVPAVRVPGARVYAVRSTLRGGPAGRGHGEGDGGRLGRAPVGGLALVCGELRWANSEFYVGGDERPSVLAAVQAADIAGMGLRR